MNLRLLWMDQGTAGGRVPKSIGSPPSRLSRGALMVPYTYSIRSFIPLLAAFTAAAPLLILVGAPRLVAWVIAAIVALFTLGMWWQTFRLWRSGAPPLVLAEDQITIAGWDDSGAIPLPIFRTVSWTWDDIESIRIGRRAGSDWVFLEHVDGTRMRVNPGDFHELTRKDGKKVVETIRPFLPGQA